MSVVSSEHSLPPGLRFQPTKEEILIFFLRPAINGELSIPYNVLIECDVYGENKEPWKLFDKESKSSFWVFTKLKSKSKLRFDRTAGRGCWHGRNITEVRDAKGELLGFDKYFTFTCKNDPKGSSRNNGNWVMHEFSLTQEGLNEYVICEIRNRDSEVEEGQNKKKRKNQKRKRKTSSDEADDDEEEEETITSIPASKKVRPDNDELMNNNGSHSVDSGQLLDPQVSQIQTHDNPISESCNPSHGEGMDQFLATFQLDHSVYNTNFEEDIDEILKMIEF